MRKDSSTQLQRLIERLNEGDPGAREELITQTCDRLRRLTRKVFQDFPRLRRWEDSGDVAQEASLRLMRRLQNARVDGVSEFFRLAAGEVRRALLDMARHYSVRVQAPMLPRKDEDACGNRLDVSAGTHQPDRLAQWTDFHRAVDNLPEEERAVFELLWYHGRTQEEAAVVLEVSPATVRRRWIAARLHLRQAFPDADRD